MKKKQSRYFCTCTTNLKKKNKIKLKNKVVNIFYCMKRLFIPIHVVKNENENEKNLMTLFENQLN